MGLYVSFLLYNKWLSSVVFCRVAFFGACFSAFRDLQGSSPDLEAALVRQVGPTKPAKPKPAKPQPGDPIFSASELIHVQLNVNHKVSLPMESLPPKV